VTMTRSRMDARHVGIVSVALALVLAALVLGLSAPLQLAMLAVGVVAAALHANLARLGAWGPAGLAYSGLSAISLAQLRGDDLAGLSAILFLFAVVWATDILAYFVGRAVGGPKLAPRISPGKTWSGAIGGTVAGIVAGMVVWALGAPVLGAVAFAALGFALSVASQVGDLFESWIKRRFAFKDSSRLIPGHGGVMDRVDGLVAAAFLLFLIAALSAGAERPAHALFIG
jgi:phosphatidate cytidylyltransferase